MLEMKIGANAIDQPYSVRVYGITEEMFDELTDEDTKADLIDGVMIMHSPASLMHENLASFVLGLMRFYASRKSLGLVIASGNGVTRLKSGRKLSPDGFFIRKDRVQKPLPKQFSGAPDLVLEVLSPSNRQDDLTIKRKAYRDAGVTEIWFVDYEYKKLIVDVREADGYIEQVIAEGRFTSLALKGFWVDVSWLWQEPQPDELACLQQILGEDQISS